MHDFSVAHLFIFTPTKPVNTHMQSYLCAKPATLKNTHTSAHTNEFLHTVQLKNRLSRGVFACALHRTCRPGRAVILACFYPTTLNKAYMLNL